MHLPALQRDAPLLTFESSVFHSSRIGAMNLHRVVAEVQQRDGGQSVEASATLVVEYRAESTHPVSLMTKQKKRVAGRGPEPAVSFGRFGRRGERPDPVQPYRVRKNGHHGAYAIDE